MATQVKQGSRASTAEQVRGAIERGGERLWTVQDFPTLPFPAVAQALSRLTRRGEISRIAKGLYYRPRETPFGASRPNPKLLRDRATKLQPVFPAGLTAANLLGFTTQVPAREEVATTGGSLPRAMIGHATRVYTRRPRAWASLTEKQAAILDFIRRRGETSELSPEKTVRKLLGHLRVGRTFERLARVAIHEPPRVRAMLGALGQDLGMKDAKLAALRSSLNPLSRFDFGILKVLKSAGSWQVTMRKTGKALHP